MKEPEEKLEYDAKAIGRRTLQLIIEQNMTREEVFKKVDRSESYFSRAVRGKRNFNLETFVKLCGTLNANPTYLISGIGPKYLKK